MVYQTLPLYQGNMSLPVLYNYKLDGIRDINAQGVQAFIVDDGDHSWCLIADHPGNTGVSVTNSYLNYAEAVCRFLKIRIDEFHWFELDSMGEFNVVGFAVDAVFAPICIDGCKANSVDAFRRHLVSIGCRCDGTGFNLMFNKILSPFKAANGVEF
jgi:hypothetical protein